MVCLVEMSSAVQFLSQGEHFCFPSVPWRAGVWDTCKSSKLCNLLLSCLREVPALKFAPPGIKFSNHIKLPSLEQAAIGKADRGRLHLVGLSPAKHACVDCTFWPLTLLLQLNQPIPTRCLMPFLAIFLENLAVFLAFSNPLFVKKMVILK